jgi:hypothetical protein
MPRGKRKHDRLLFGAIPWWLYGLLENGYVTASEFIIWAVIRGYVKDAEPGVFSPPAIDLTNREIARGAALTQDRIRTILQDLEAKGLLYRIVGAELSACGLSGNRWLLLLAPKDIEQHYYPLAIRGGIDTGGIDTPGINNNSSSARRSSDTPPSSASDGDLVIDARAREGGVGGESHTPLAHRGGMDTGGMDTGGIDAGGINTGGIDTGGIDTPGIDTGGNRKGENSNNAPPRSSVPRAQVPEVGDKRADVGATLQELGAFPGPAFEIADCMLAAERFNALEGNDLLAEVRDTFFRVYRQSREDARHEREAMRFTIDRLRNGDWGERIAATDREAQSRRYDTYAEYCEDGSRPPATEEVSEAHQLWQEILNVTELQMTKATFNTWLRGTRALEINGDGQTLVVQVVNRYAVEWLSNKLYPVLQRALGQVLLDRQEDGDALLDIETAKIRFVVPEGNS